MVIPSMHPFEVLRREQGKEDNDTLDAWQEFNFILQKSFASTILRNNTTMKLVIPLHFLLCATCYGDEILEYQNLRRRIIKSERDLVARNLFLDEDTDVARERRHRRYPEERNVFERSTDTVPTSNPSRQPTPALKPLPTLTPTSPQTTGSPTSRLTTKQPTPPPSSIDGDINKDIRDFLSQRITDDGSIMQEGTPQNKALISLSTTNPQLDPGKFLDAET
jgi:hypothetical protein